LYGTQRRGRRTGSVLTDKKREEREGGVRVLPAGKSIQPKKIRGKGAILFHYLCGSKKGKKGRGKEGGGVLFSYLNAAEKSAITSNSSQRSRGGKSLSVIKGGG